MASSKQVHVLAVPLPEQGHLNSLMRLCKLLACQGVLVTFVNIDPVHERIEKLNMQQELEQEAEEEEESEEAAAAAKHGGYNDYSQKEIRRAHIPIQGLNLANESYRSPEAFSEAQSSIALPLEALILELNLKGPPVTCLITDVTMASCTQDVANKLNIPVVVLVPFSASGFLLARYVIQGNHISIQEVLARLSRRTSKKEVVLEGLPGLPTIYNDEAFCFKHIIDDNVDMWERAKTLHEKFLPQAHAFVFNSFNNLEESALATLSKQLDPPIYQVGPLVEPLQKDSSTSLWKENKTCLHWLDQQPHLSVLYISFGSVVVLTQTQFEEILIGLVSSKQLFLWALRPNLVENMSYSTLSLDISSRSHGKGYVVDWAPQIEVLSHPSMGGFLTHCGWNSIIEAIFFGVPMLCWPCITDQFVNAKYIVEEWKVGLKCQPTKDAGNLVESCEVERVIKALMEGDEGKALRNNAMCLKEASNVSILPEGTSYQNIQALLKSLSACLAT